MTVGREGHDITVLLEGVGAVLLNSIAGSENCHISSICVDSRKCQPGSLFIALQGIENDGHNFISQAVEAGSSCIIVQAGRLTASRCEELGVLCYEVNDTALAYSLIAANFFGNPGKQIRLIGVTGTNGKTTVTYILEKVLLREGFSVGVIGTINKRYTLQNGLKKVLPTLFTTPEPFLLQQVLREMADYGVNYVIMEVSSHGLAQSRVGGLFFDVTGFTNISRDHLDYHRDFEDYFLAKRKLFTKHMHKGVAVIPDTLHCENGSRYSRLLEDACKESRSTVVKWGESDDATIRLSSYEQLGDQMNLRIMSSFGSHQLTSKLVGGFNVENLLCVFGLAKSIGLNEDKIIDHLRYATAAPGRLELVTSDGFWPSDGPAVFVDYAHTPDALQKVLQTVSSLDHVELYCVFGCGGDRDTGKRSIMGGVASKYADVVIITDDNPRTEDPNTIIRGVLEGVHHKACPVRDESWLFERKAKEVGAVVINSRQEAIKKAISAAGSEDIVLIAGKGHETYQEINSVRSFFDDRLEAIRALTSWTPLLVQEGTKSIHSNRKVPKSFLGEVVTDSRQVSSGAIFVALNGERFNGHDFCHQAVERGARCLVVSEQIETSDDVCTVQVEDTVGALGELAKFRRNRIAQFSECKLIGITGSCGKTTVKEMVAAILERKWRSGPGSGGDCVLKTSGNFNNLIGVPLSLLPIDVSHRAVVLEMGMNQPGELRQLAEIGDPDISCILNIHGAHLEGLQTLEGVARAKEELFRGTKDTATLIVNLDDPLVVKLSQKYKQEKFFFSSDPLKKEEADVWGCDFRLNSNNTVQFTLHALDGKCTILLNVIGHHNIKNALAASTISIAAGASLQEIAEGLQNFEQPDKRMQVLCNSHGIQIINDTYNANPASMAAGIATLQAIAPKKTVAILGDMLELGKLSQQAHFDIGKLLAQTGIDYVGITGDFKNDIVDGALANGFAKANIGSFENKESIIGWYEFLVSEKMIGQDDVVLVKASRGLRFETIVADIME